MKAYYSPENGTEKGEDMRSNRTRQNNKTADRRMESNDNPENPDRGGGGGGGVLIFIVADRGEDVRNSQPPFGPPKQTCR